MAENQYKIELGVHVKTSQIREQISSYNQNSNNAKLKLGIKLDTADLKKQINQLNLDGKGVNIPLNTASLESSLKEVKDIIADIKKSLGVLGDGNGMKNLLTSVNQIATALGKAEDESKSLVNSLNALSKKDFSFNLNLKAGNANPVKSMTDYGQVVTREVIPALKKQISYLKDVISETKDADRALEQYLFKQYRGHEGVTVKKNLENQINTGLDLDGNKISKNQQMLVAEEYIGYLKEVASLNKVDLSEFNAKFSKSATEMIDDATKIQSGAKDVEEQFEKLKGIFGGGINSENLSRQLESIVGDLKEIKNALTDLSGQTPLNQLKTSFDTLSKSITELIQNCGNISAAFNEVGNVGANVGSSINNELVNSFNNGMETVQASATETSGVISSLKTTLETMKLDRSSIDAITNDIEELGFEVTDASVKMKNGNFDITVKGIDDIGRAVTEIRHLDSATKKISGVSRTISQSFKEIDAFAKQQKRAVTDLTNQINQLNRAAIDQNAARPIKEVAHLDSLKAKYNEIISAIETMGAASNASFEDERNKVKTLITEYKSLKSEYKNAENVALQMDGNDFASGLEIAKNKLAEFKSQAQGFSKLTPTIKELDKAIEGVGDVSSLKEFNNQLRVARSELSKVKTEASSVGKIKFKLADTGFNGFEQEVQRAHVAVDKLKNSSPKLQNALMQLDAAMKAVNSANKENDTQKLVIANKKYEAALKQVYSQLKLNQQAENDVFKKGSFEAAKEGALLRLRSLFSENSEAAKLFGSELDRIQRELNECGDTRGLTRINREITNLGREVKNASVSTQTFGQRLKKQFQQYSSYLSVYSLFSYGTQALRSMFEQVKLIDSAMTELKKVTNETDEAYNNFLKKAGTRSREIGTTIDGLVSSTADFARLGYGFKDAQGLAEVANIYAVVGDEIEGVEGATESLISTMAAFKDEMNGMSNTDFAMSIIDKFNEIGNNFAISSGGIGEALERSASSLMAANNTIDESIALITAANTVVQDPAAVGTAFKTISMRIRGAKTELEEAGLETEGMVDSTAKLREEILALSGVDIMENANEFKSTYQIMDELAVKWKDLTDIQQASITELIAGKRQGNIISSLMTNFDTARDALETSINSAGSAMAEHEKWQQSLEAQINKLKASWQSLSQTFLSSDFLKVTFDFVIKLVDGITLLIDKVGVLPTLFTGFAIFKSLGNKGLFKTFNNDLDGFINKIGIANKSFADLVNVFNFGKTGKGLKGFISGLSAMKNSLSTTLTKADLGNIQAYNDLLDQGVTAQTAWYRTMQTSSDSAKDLVASANGGKVALNGMKTASIGAKIGLIGAKVAAVAFNAALTMGISLLIDWAISGIMKLVNAKKELAEQVDEITSKFKEQSNELKKLKGDYDTTNESSMISKYEKLSKGVDGLGRNVSLTADEYSEYQSIVNQIADQIPSLITGYDSQGNAILSCKDNVEKLTEAYEKLIHAQNQDILSNAGKIEENYANISKGKGNGIWNQNTTNEDIEALEYIYTNSLKTKEEITEYLKSKFGSAGTTKVAGIAAALESAGVENADWGWNTGEENIEALAKQLQTNPSKIKGIIDNYYGQFAEAVEQQKSIAQAKLSEAFDISDKISQLNYGNISEDLQAVAYQVVGSLDKNFFDKLQEEGKSVEDWTTELLDQFNSIGKDDNAKIEMAFNLKTRFNNGEVTYGEYVKGIQEAKDVISALELDDEVKNTIKLSLDDEDIKTQYNHIRGYLRDFYTNKDARKMDRDEEYDYKFKARENDKKVEAFLNSLTADELQAVIDIKTEIDWANTDAEKIRKQIEDRVKLNEALNFNADIEIDTTALEALNTALSESASAIGLSEESIDSLKSKYADLEGYNPHTLFEKTANGVKVNREELAKLEQKYNDLTKTEVQEHLDTLVEEYNKCTKAIDGNIGSQEKLELISKREKYAEQIEELATYQAQLEGVTGAYQRWLDAQNTPEDYEGYELVATSREDIQDEIGRGFLSNSTKEYIDLLSGEDLVGGTIDDYANAWAKLDEKVGSTSYSIHDFFTVNDDGDITSTGIDRFFKGLQQDFKGSVAEFNKETGQWEYDFSQENLKKIQDEWGIGIEAIEILLEAAASAGYDVDWGGIFDDLDLDTSNFESLISVAESAQKELNKLKGYENLDFNFSTTNVEDATSELEKAQKTYDELVTNKDGTINLNAKGAEQARIILATLLVQKQQLEDSEIAINISTSGLDDSQAKAVAWVQDFRTKYKNLEIAISTGEGIEEAKTELETVKTSLGELDGDTAKIAAQLVLGEDTNTSGDGFKTQVNNAIDSIGKQDINVGFKLDETTISDLNSQLLTNFTVDATAKITNVDKSQLEAVETSGMVNWNENTDGVSKSFEADGTVNWDDNVKNVKTSFSANGTVKWTSGNKVKVKVISEANGTANANGTTGRAFARGNWGINGSGVALGGELGRELVVRDGKFFTIGDTGAEFFRYKPNDIIFNAAQTESLFKYGGIKGAKPRGTVYADGSAFVQGSHPLSGSAFWKASASTSKFATMRDALTKPKNKTKAKTETKTTTKDDTVEITNKITLEPELPNMSANATGKSKSLQNISETAGEKAKEEKKEFEEVFDWIETAISRIEREIDNLDRTANNTYKSWSTRNKALAGEISKVSEEIKLQNNAAQEYLKEANSIGLSESWAKKVREGTLDIDTLNEKNSSEETIEKIKNYQKWYELYLKCIDAAEELKETESKLYAQRFENVQSQYDNILQGFEHTESMLNEYISQAEAKGHIVSKNYYNALIDNEKKNIDVLKREQADLIAERDKAVADGKIVKGSEAWYEQCAAIDDVTQAIESGTTSIIEYNNAIRDIDFEIFDLIQERISDITAEADFLIELMSNKDLFDDNGKFTEQGAATVGLHAQNYNAYMYQADDYGAKVAEIDSKIASGELDGYSKDVVDKRREYIELQREMILNAEKEKDAIKDLVSEGIELELEALDERIQKYQDALDAQKDLYDYQKRVEEQTKEISSLQKQISSYAGDNSEEAKAKIQELRVSLEEAEADLEETEYDKYISDQQKLLDALFLEYESVLNMRLDNIDFLLESIIAEINASAGAEGAIATALGSDGALATILGSNAATIKDTLTSETAKVGIKLSDAMNSIWSIGDGNAKSILTMYGEGFQNKQTTTNSVLSGIKVSVDSMVSLLGQEAAKKTTANKTSSSSVKNPTSTTSNNKSQSSNQSSNNGAKTLSEDKLMGIAASIWVDGHESGWGNDPVRSGKLTEKFGIEIAKKVQSLINTYGANGGLYNFWVKKNKNLDSYHYNAFKFGARDIDESQLAWTQEGRKQEYIVRPSDGAILTPVAKKDSVLNAQASSNIWNMANSPAEFIKDNLNFNDANVPNNSTVQNSYTQHLDNVVFNLPNVRNYEELLSEMQKDKNFENLINSMTIGRLAGKSSLAKGKAIR